MSREDQKRQLPFWYDLRRLSGLTTCLFSFSFFFYIVTLALRRTGLTSSARVKETESNW